jgi:2,4-dienoyl-CoA reductase (NADPH2)
MDRRATCITCSRCTQIMRDHGRTGCVPFDREVYGPIYAEGRATHT